VLCLCDRDATGRIIKPAPFQSRLAPGTVARVEPNRRWFGECSFSSIHFGDIVPEEIEFVIYAL